MQLFYKMKYLHNLNLKRLLSGVSEEEQQENIAHHCTPNAVAGRGDL
jgi:hypothetical protein